MSLSRRVFRVLPWLLLPVLAGCSDLRSTFEIKGSAHALTLIRETSVPWDKTAKYSIVAARMPDCMRKHPMGKAPLNAKVEIFSPGNDAWIIRLNGRLYVTETRSCEGFSPLDKEPEDGLGAPAGVFEMRNEALVFTAAPKVVPPPAPPAPEVQAESVSAPAAVEVATAPVVPKN
ncbi:MAG: hypothetical protein WCL27_01350 [Betaproteobacteria bacterium]